MDGILIPVDFTKASGNSLRYAHFLSQHLGKALCLLHCYPTQDYNRSYDFGKKEYSIGITEKLMTFYQEYVDKEVGQAQFLARAGSISEHVASMSQDFDLVVMSLNKFDSNVGRWMGSRASYISSMARCPVLIVPPTTSPSDWKKIWHIKRNDVETKILAKRIPKFKIQLHNVEVKTFE